MHHAARRVFEDAELKPLRHHPEADLARIRRERQFAAKANALLEGKDAAAKPERFVVQVGAYSEAAKLREVRQKLEKAGLKTYTQVVDTKDGKRTRVRVGPFGSTAEADKVAARIKGLDLPAGTATSWVVPNFDAIASAYDIYCNCIKSGPAGGPGDFTLSSIDRKSVV